MPSQPLPLRLLADFGHEIGVPGLAPGPDGGTQLRFDTGGALGVVQQDDDVVLHWAEPVRYGIPALLLRAMQRAAEPQPGLPPVQVALRTTPDGDWLVVAVRLAADRCDGRTLAGTADALRRWTADLGASA